MYTPNSSGIPISIRISGNLKSQKMIDSKVERIHKKDVVTRGKGLDKAKKALIMLHGRGANAGDILGLAQYLNVSEYAVIAPQATNHTWYPYSFLVPPLQNEPWLSSALALVGDVISDINNQGIESANIYFVGFSQGASLTLEFVARNARRWGGVAAFTGGLIGDKINQDNYKGDFAGTPIFIGTSDPDFHVPVDRVQASADALRSMGAEVSVKVYPNMGHTISEDEIGAANRLVFK